MNLDDRRFLEAIGHRIRERRMAQGLTQAELADRCKLHRTFVGSVERGERNVAVLNLRKIARGAAGGLRGVLYGGVVAYFFMAPHSALIHSATVFVLMTE